VAICYLHKKIIDPNYILISIIFMFRLVNRKAAINSSFIPWPMVTSVKKFPRQKNRKMLNIKPSRSACNNQYYYDGLPSRLLVTERYTYKILGKFVVSHEAIMMWME